MDRGGASTSTKPYLLRALHEWCSDNGYTPYLAVHVDARVRVPREHVKNGEIVLNVSYSATSSLQLGNADISFRARFGGVARDVMVPVSHVTAIYARETGQGMAFPLPSDQELGAPEAIAADAPMAAEPTPEPPPRLHSVSSESAATSGDTTPDEPPPRPSGPHLKRVK